ncbi:MAG: cell division protein ZapE, partial [Rhodospirillaceae bacterium]|nr:cell division protein ZapE [Rhodospirillaceae bacterium]
MPQGPLSKYREQIATGKIRPDPTQALAVEKLQSLYNALKLYEPTTGQQGWKERLGLSSKAQDVPQGLYFYG